MSSPESIVTCFETSEKLKEAGFDKETVFVWIKCPENTWRIIKYSVAIDLESPLTYPAPTSCEIELPFELFNTRWKMGNPTLEIGWDEKSWTLRYAGYEGHCSNCCEYEIFCSVTAPTEVEAKAKMWLYLKQQGLLKEE